MTRTSHNSAFHNLRPDQILDAVEACGFRCDGRLQAMASYENRVYQIGLTDDAPLVAKFYRPARWSDEQILEEHNFSLELLGHELPVLAPLAGDDGTTLHHHELYRVAFYPLLPGRAPSLDDPEQRQLMGRFAARLHNVAALGSFATRPELDINADGEAALAAIDDAGTIPADISATYIGVAVDALNMAIDLLDGSADYPPLRLHGDLHAGNILWTHDGPHVLDFDDCLTGPAIGDVWMCLSGDRDYQQACLADVVEGYEQFRPFPFAQLVLIEPLRTLRLVRHSAWISQRWSDPAFPRAFPWFDTPRYWQDQILTLREQLAVMNEAPLRHVI